MLLLLSLLVACNPEHNPADVAELSYLQGSNDQLESSLSTISSERDMLRDQVNSQAEALEAFSVVARAYQAAVNLTGDELVVCYPPLLLDEVDVLDPQEVQPNATHTEPWVQAAVSPGCGEPVVLSLVEKEEAPASEPVASVDGAPSNPAYRLGAPPQPE